MMHLKTALIGCMSGTVLMCAQADDEMQDNNVSKYLLQVKNQFVQLLPAGSYPAQKKSNLLNQWIESSEIRLTTDNDDDRKSSLALNLKIKNWSELSMQQQLFQLLEQRQQLDQQEILNDHLQSSYIQLLELNSKLEELAQLKQRSRLFASAIKYQQQLVQSSDFSPDELLQIELMQRNIDELEKSIEFNAPQPFLQITPQQMIATAENYLQHGGGEVEQAQLELQLAKLKLKQQQASAGFALNALQLKSDFSENEDAVLAVRFDIQIPFSGPDFNSRLKHQEINQATMRLHQRRQQTSLKSNQILAKMYLNKKALVSTEQLINDIESRIKKTTSVKLILKLKKQHLSSFKQILEIRYQLRLNYINFLSQQGLLAKHNEHNWLSAQTLTGFTDP
jgi:hypothetical protein